MAKKITFLIMMVIVSELVRASDTDSLLNQLNETISRSEIYLQSKQIQLRELKDRVREPGISLERQFNLYNELFYAYQPFRYDSAFSYAVKLRNTASQLNDDEKALGARLKLNLTLLSSGMYKEAFDSLKNISIENVADQLKKDYYELMSRAYYDLATYNADKYYTDIYTKKGHAYTDSALTIMDTNSYRGLYLQGMKHLKRQQFEDAKKYFHTILNEYQPAGHKYAIVASTLAGVYKENKEDEQAIDFLIKAAIADIESSTTEAVALINLADLLYKKGQVSLAYSYIKQALRDADYYGAKQRKIQASYILPIIEQAQMSKVETQRKRLYTYSIAITMLSILIIVFAVIIYLQLKQLKKSRTNEAAMNEHLHKTNDMLQDANHRLEEANAIKEEYIGHSFNLYTDYLEKIENLKKGVNRKLLDRKFSEIGHVMNSINLKKERENLYISFDKIFLNLFPNFIATFNSYFREGDRFMSADNEPLSAELRIFALIRIGIHDHEQIAKILEYSVRTVYNYKTKVKNKSILSNEEFEQKVMEIRAF